MMDCRRHGAGYNGRRPLRLLAVSLSLAALLAGGMTAMATPGFEPAVDGRLVVVGEPDNISDKVEYYRGEEQADISELNWVEGKFGQGVRLNGQGELLRLWREQLQLAEVTFAGWINWQGAAEGQPEESAYGQRFFTFSRSTDNWLTFSPHMRDTSAAKTDGDGNPLDGILDGVFLEMNQKGGLNKQLWQPVTDGVSDFALPQNEWHHVAVTMDGFDLKLYIDGVLWQEEQLVLQMRELYMLQFTVGGSIFGDASLNAIVDEVYLYNYTLDAQAIAKLAAGVDPTDPEATLPSEGPYLPTEPTQTQPSTPSTQVSYVTRPANTSNPLLIGTIFGLPKPTVLIVGGILALFIILCIGLNVYYFVHDRRSGEKGPEDKNGGDGA